MAGTFEVSKYELPSCSGFEKRLVKSGSIWCSAPRTTTSGCWAPSSPRACSRAGSTLWSASGRGPGIRRIRASTWGAFLKTRWIYFFLNTVNSIYALLSSNPPVCQDSGLSDCHKRIVPRLLWLGSLCQITFVTLGWVKTDKSGNWHSLNSTKHEKAKSSCQM